MKRRLLIWLPLIASLALLGIFYAGLKRPDDRVITSRMVGKPLPAFTTTAPLPDVPAATEANFRDGKPRLLNIFASWCIPCVAEMKMLNQLRSEGIEIVGIAVGDSPENIRAFLTKHGNPYSRVGLDTGSRFQVNMGSSGVPETFVIDGKGIIRHQHISAITPADAASIRAILASAR